MLSLRRSARGPARRARIPSSPGGTRFSHVFRVVHAAASAPFARRHTPSVAPRPAPRDSSRLSATVSTATSTTDRPARSRARLAGSRVRLPQDRAEVRRREARRWAKGVMHPGSCASVESEGPGGCGPPSIYPPASQRVRCTGCSVAPLLGIGLSCKRLFGIRTEQIQERW